MGIHTGKVGEYLVICLVAVFLTACAGTQPQTNSSDPDQVQGDPECKNNSNSLSLGEKLEQHVVRINQNGFVVRPDISLFGHKEKFFNELLSRPVFEEKIDKMLACAEHLAKSKITHKSKPTKVKLLIHVHGGLNFFADTDDRVMTLGSAIQDDGEDWHYPIFVSWPSSALGTFGEHLWSIRGGRKVSPLHGAISLPFVLVSDLLQVGAVISSMYMQAERGFFR